MAGVYEQMLRIRKECGAGYVVLLDPDKEGPEDLARRAEMVGRYADILFIGGSICVRHDFDEAVAAAKGASGVPVVIFPGDATQVSSHADALLFLSLVSGRNPDLLIGEHVKAAPLIRRVGLETIPVAYMLVESGETTSVQYMSQTLAIPAGKPEIAMAHAQAGEYLGMKMVFLEAGSGARRHAPPDMIRAVSGYVSLPVIVGGGVRTPADAAEVVAAGASFVVTGDVIEKHGSAEMLKEFSAAVHGSS
jgi:putative glycerol-1-phosphate prenyltransferase